MTLVNLKALIFETTQFTFITTMLCNHSFVITVFLRPHSVFEFEIRKYITMCETNHVISHSHWLLLVFFLFVYFQYIDLQICMDFISLKSSKWRALGAFPQYQTLLAKQVGDTFIDLNEVAKYMQYNGCLLCGC